MARAFMAGAGAAFASCFGFLLTMGGVIITAKYMLRQMDPIGKMISSAFKPPRL